MASLDDEILIDKTLTLEGEPWRITHKAEWGDYFFLYSTKDPAREAIVRSRGILVRALELEREADEAEREAERDS